MGVPAFFRWLSNKYPSIVSHCVEAKANFVESDEHNIDLNLPNPNGIEFDNFYIDMNGIIHPCCHPENKVAPSTLDDMMEAIFEYMDRLFNIVRPRKLIYFAVDGVAPRAKMNQQRSRRYRTARDNLISQEVAESTRELVRGKGFHVPDPVNKNNFDNNCITPGTEFMAHISNALRQYIASRVNNNSGWQDLIVILSDAAVPGEGEHKIMDFIRKQRVNPSYDPNLTHCIYGADADLIMLGLVTHEPNFAIIREEFKPNMSKPCIICHKHGHSAKDCTGVNPGESSKIEDSTDSFIGLATEFIFIRLSVLREYLDREFELHTFKRKLDFERCIDDWILLCFLVGNDFLPHLPSLEIREGALDNLLRIYKNRIDNLDGYLSDNGFVNFTNLKIILSDLGRREDETFKNRAKRESYYNKRTQQEREDETPNKVAKIDEIWRRDKLDMTPKDPSSILANTSNSSNKTESQSNVSFDPNTSTDSRKRRFRDRDLDSSIDRSSVSVSIDEDPVKLGQDGWKFRYYATKFKTTREDIDIRRAEVSREYLIGINWVLQYYYQGCPSWNWFYPFNYSPFASDCELVGPLSTIFPKSSKPFEPFEQLMAVLPPGSSTLLPTSYKTLMMSEDSPIVDFYPKSFLIDLNGKRFEWQGVALLPFIDETRLIKEINKVKPALDEADKIRNNTSNAIMIVRETHIIGEEILKNYSPSNIGKFVKLEDWNCSTLFGEVFLTDPRSTITPNSNISSSDKNISEKNYLVCVDYRDPSFPEDMIFESRMLSGARAPKPCLKPLNYSKHEHYNPVVNFPDSSPSPFHLTLPAHRFIRHNMPIDRYRHPSPYPRFPPPIFNDRVPAPRFPNRAYPRSNSRGQNISEFTSPLIATQPDFVSPYPQQPDTFSSLSEDPYKANSSDQIHHSSGQIPFAQKPYNNSICKNQKTITTATLDHNSTASPSKDDKLSKTDGSI